MRNRHVPGVNKIEDILLPAKFVFHLYGVALNGDASLLLKIHVVKHLPFRYLNRVCTFQKTVGNGTLTVVDVSNDAEITYMLHEFNPKLFAKIQKMSFFY